MCYFLTDYKRDRESNRTAKQRGSSIARCQEKCVVCSIIFKFIFKRFVFLRVTRTTISRYLSDCISTITARAFFPRDRDARGRKEKVASSTSGEGRRRTAWSLLQLRLNSKHLLPPWRQTLTGLEIFMMHSPPVHDAQDLPSNASYSSPRGQVICLRRLLFEIR